jgi:hypothetical protein
MATALLKLEEGAPIGIRTGQGDAAVGATYVREGAGDRHLVLLSAEVMNQERPGAVAVAADRLVVYESYMDSVPVLSGAEDWSSAAEAPSQTAVVRPWGQLSSQMPSNLPVTEGAFPGLVGLYGRSSSGRLWEQPDAERAQLPPSSGSRSSSSSHSHKRSSRHKRKKSRGRRGCDKRDSSSRRGEASSTPAYVG